MITETILPTTAGVAVTTATLLTVALSPAAHADPEPTTAVAIRNAASALLAHAASLGLTSAENTSVRDVIVDRDGTQHVRCTRTYRRLPVLGGDFVVHLRKDGGYLGADRASRGTISLASIVPDISAPKAAGLAVNALRAVHLGDGLRQVEARPELVVDALHGTPELAWRTNAAGRDSLGNPVARTVPTDARTGRRIDAWDSIETATGDGKLLYSGTVPLETTPSGSSYDLTDPTRGGTYTGDAANQTDLCVFGICITRAPSTAFTDADNHWGTGTTADRASAAVDAQYGTDMTWDFYKNVLGRNGIAGDGKGSYNRVHYGNSYNNAFWDDSCFCMTYGDGDGTTFGPLVALDVAGHEMTHGVTSKTAGLAYTGESGGLNEATSDVLGTMVEFYANNPSDPGDYLIGAKTINGAKDLYGAGSTEYDAVAAAWGAVNVN
ncbi:M4 family metallopeptidase [Streptomyces sp. NPDC088560]|uniref:M4 family metallopeptidase n=1 Tax=Streptomyces sp. NPDC088560 TaxID=3365868 RepID=UPI0037FFDAE5